MYLTFAYRFIEKKGWASSDNEGNAKSDDGWNTSWGDNNGPENGKPFNKNTNSKANWNSSWGGGSSDQDSSDNRFQKKRSFNNRNNEGNDNNFGSE